MSIAQLPAGVRAVARARQILSVFLKYGFGDLVDRLGFVSSWHAFKTKLFPKKAESPIEALTTEERIRRAFEELGPTFVKLGQILATRPDLIPMSLVTELRKLQDHVAPFAGSDVTAIVEAELKRPIAELFQSFDPAPLAAASIAQVHKAVLKDGRKVVLKIQRPNIEKNIDTDLSIIAFFAELAEEKIPEVRRYNMVGIVREFRKSIMREIDFEREAYHVKRFARNFKDDPAIYVPKVYDELTTRRVLCEEFIDGVKLDSEGIRSRPSLDRETIAKTGIRFTLEQIFVHGFFHADPHPGNLFVMEGNRLCAIDFGMMGILDQERIDELLGFLVALLTRDTDAMVRLFYKLRIISDDTDVRALRLDLDDLLRRYESVELQKINVGRYIGQLFDVIVRHEMILPQDLLLMGKSLATIDGVARDIYPELDPLEAIRPHVLRIYMGRLTDPHYFTREPKRVAEELWHLAQTAPRDMRLLLSHLRKGEATLKLELDGFVRSTRDRAQSMNRVALAIVMAALVLGSCYLVVQSDATLTLPLVGAAIALKSVVGAVGLLLASFFGFVLLIGFVRSGGI